MLILKVGLEKGTRNEGSRAIEPQSRRHRHTLGGLVGQISLPMVVSVKPTEKKYGVESATGGS